MDKKLVHHRNKNFRIEGYHLDRGAPQEGSVTITAGDRPLFRVRPLHGQRTYTLSLAFVAAMVVSRCIKDEIKNWADVKEATKN